MGRPHPVALRTRVVGFVEEGNTHRAAAAHFRVSIKFVNDMVKLKRETGSLDPKPPGRQKDNLGPPDRLLSRVPVRDDLLKPSPISRRNRDGSSRSHAPGSHAETLLEIPNTNFIRSDTTTSFLQS